MLDGARILAVVPARSGSKGLPDKNLRELAGTSLIGHAGLVLGECPWIDLSVLSTDSERYAEEGREYGLEVPSLRPAALATDASDVRQVLHHELRTCEDFAGMRFDVVLVVEPTSPLRRADDLRSATRLLLDTAAGSVVTVTTLDAKCHPDKILRTTPERSLTYFSARGSSIVNRQELAERFYYRNGICYALRRDVVSAQREIVGDLCLPLVIDRPVANIDTPLDLAWAEFLMSRATD